MKKEVKKVNVFILDEGRISEVELVKVVEFEAVGEKQKEFYVCDGKKVFNVSNYYTSKEDAMFNAMNGLAKYVGILEKQTDKYKSEVDIMRGDINSFEEKLANYGILTGKKTFPMQTMGIEGILGELKSEKEIVDDFVMRKEPKWFNAFLSLLVLFAGMGVIITVMELSKLIISL